MHFNYTSFALGWTALGIILVCLALVWWRYSLRSSRHLEIKLMEKLEEKRQNETSATEWAKFQREVKENRQKLEIDVYSRIISDVSQELGKARQRDASRKSGEDEFVRHFSRISGLLPFGALHTLIIIEGGWKVFDLRYDSGCANVTCERYTRLLVEEIKQLLAMGGRLEFATVLKIREEIASVAGPGIKVFEDIVGVYLNEEWYRAVLSQIEPDESLLVLSHFKDSDYDLLFKQSASGDKISKRMLQILRTKKPESFQDYVWSTWEIPGKTQITSR